MHKLYVKLRIEHEDGVEYNIIKEYGQFSLDDIMEYSRTLWCKYGDHRIYIYKDNWYHGLIDVWEVNDQEYINIRFPNMGVSVNGLRYKNFSIFDSLFNR